MNRLNPKKRSKGVVISHRATFTPFSALIQSAQSSHVMAVLDNKALWHCGQQEVNGRKHFFGAALGAAAAWVGCLVGVPRQLQALRRLKSSLTQGPQVHIAQSTSVTKIYKYSQINVYYTLYNHRYLKTYKNTHYTDKVSIYMNMSSPWGGGLVVKKQVARVKLMTTQSSYPPVISFAIFNWHLTFEDWSLLVCKVVQGGHWPSCQLLFRFVSYSQAATLWWRQPWIPPTSWIDVPS